MDEIEHDKENLKRGDFFKDSKLKNILNHARFVPLPKTVIKEEDTGAYYQHINLLEAPLYFVPQRRKHLTGPILENQATLMEHDILTTSSSAPEDMDYISTTIEDTDVDIDESDIEDETIIQAPQSSAKQSIEWDLLHKESEELELDIEGENDVMDRIQPWKIRLHMRQQLDNSQTKDTHPVEKKKRSLSPPSDPTFQLEHKSKRKKKSARFA